MMKDKNKDKAKEKINKPNIEEELDKYFPKGKSKSRGKALVLVATAELEKRQFKKDLKEKIMDWCWKHNTIPMKDLYKDLPNSTLSLATTDGGWVNVLELRDFLEKL